MLQGQEHFMMPQVPFADSRCGVAFLLQHLSDGCFRRIDANTVCWKKRTRNTESVGITTREQSCSGCTTNGLRSYKIGEADTFIGHPVDVRRLIVQRPGNTQIAITHIVQEDQDHVGLGCLDRLLREALGCKHQE